MYKILCDDKEILYQMGSIDFRKNSAAILNFIILANDSHFNKLRKFKDYIKVINTANDEVVFDGRVIDSDYSMNINGELENSIVCESYLNFLNDTRVEAWGFYPLNLPEKHSEVSFENADTKMFISKVLENHNSKVNNNKKIFIGDIEVNSKIEIETNYETSLASIQGNICSRQEGYLILRNTHNKYFLDFLKESPIKKVVDINVGINLRSMSINNDEEIFSRIIPLGENNINIKSANNGVVYVESKELVEKYGVIETVINYQGVTIPENLLQKANETLTKVNIDNKINLEALDLSYIDNNFENLKLNMSVHVKNDLLNYDKIHEIVSINLNLIEPWKSQFDLNKNATSIVNTINSVEQRANENKIEIVSLGNELITKVSSNEFETYREQSDKKIKETVKDINSNIESTRTQLADKIEDKISAGDVKTIVTQDAKSWGLSINGELESKNYKFDENGFWISGKNGGCELTDTYAHWKDNSGNTFSVGATGFFKESNGVYGDIKYFNSIIRRSNLKNGYVEYIQLPNNFIGKSIDTNFSVTCMWDAIDSNMDAQFKKDALRTIFIKIVNWNSSTGVLAIQPCIQKIGLSTKTYFGYDESSTTPGNPIGEGSMDVVLIVSM